jgi:hypothetical protein
LAVLGTVGHASLLRCCNVHSFDAPSVRATCVPWVLDPHAYLTQCSASVVEDGCRNISAFVYLVAAPVSGASAEATCRRVRSLCLLDWSRVARCCLSSSRPLEDAEAEALSGYREVPD